PCAPPRARACARSGTGTRDGPRRSHRCSFSRCRAAADARSGAFLQGDIRMPVGLAILILALFAGVARADEVVLLNGDRLTGTVVRKEGDELIFRTDYAGELKIAWSRVARVATEDPMALILSDQSLAEAQVIGAVPEKKPTKAQDEVKKAAAAERAA